MDGKDNRIRHYVYDNGRLEGWYDFASGLMPATVEQFFYTGNQITGYETRTLSEPATTTDLSLGVLDTKGSIAYNKAGLVISNEIDNEPFNGFDVEIRYRYDEVGRHTTGTITSTSTGKISSLMYEYEQRPCIGLPMGSWTQNYCVQVD